MDICNPMQRPDNGIFATSIKYFSVAHRQNATEKSRILPGIHNVEFAMNFRGKTGL